MQLSFHAQMARPNPTIEELEAIIPLVSAWSWDEIIAVYTSSPHRYTNGETQLGDRLLEIQYIVTLLSYGFGFNRHKRSIHFATEVNTLLLKQLQLSGERDGGRMDNRLCSVVLSSICKQY